MSARYATRLRWLVLLALALTSAGCMRGCTSSRPPIHINPNMDFQEKYQPQEESGFFYDGRAMRPPVEGTVARGELRNDVGFFTGKDEDGNYLQTSPVPVTEQVLARGLDRYAIYCQPCHDKRGTGRGILAEYGSVPTAQFHDEQRLGYPDGQFFDVITNGFGLMKSYKYPIPPEDRWAIVAHIRHLQEERAARQAAIGAGGGG